MATDTVQASEDVPHGVRAAIESLVGELTKLSGEHGDVAPVQAPPTGGGSVGGGGDAVAAPGTTTGADTSTDGGTTTGGSEAGDTTTPTKFGGQGQVDISLTIQQKTFDVILALPDNPLSSTPLWGVEVNEGTDTLIQVLVQDGQNWRVEVSAPMLPHTFKLNTDGTDTLTIKTLGFSLVKGSPPKAFTFNTNT